MTAPYTRYQGKAQMYYPEVVHIYGKFTVVSGAITAIAARGVTSSAAKAATGKYKITLDDAFLGGLLYGSCNAEDLSGSIENDSSTSETDPHIDIEFWNGDGGSLEDPADGHFFVHFVLQTISEA